MTFDLCTLDFITVDVIVVAITILLAFELVFVVVLINAVIEA